MSPHDSGKRNAEAIIDSHGIAWAEEWIRDRVDRPRGRAPLALAYIRGYDFALAEERARVTPRGLSPAPTVRRRKRRRNGSDPVKQTKKPQTYLVIEGERDRLGRVPFTLFWSEPDGVFRPEPSNDDGAPVGYRRGQCFRAIPEQWIARGAVRVDSEAIAKRLAWGVRK